MILIIALFVVLFLFYFNKTNTSDLNIKECYANIVSPEEDATIEKLILAWTDIAKEHNIMWSTCAGTSLGVHRHQGRIPWDDDVDITIRSSDIKKLPLAFKDLKKKYNMSNAKFWGGHKIFFHRKSSQCKSYFKKYGWCWPFIDIFTISQDKNCGPIEPNEDLEWKSYGNLTVPVFKNGPRDYQNFKNKGMIDTLWDTGYRHRIETYIDQKCKPKFKN